MPDSIAEIRSVLRRDRRSADRRWGKKDSRVFRYNRRGDDRRKEREAHASVVDEDMIVEINELVSDLERLSNEYTQTSSDLTCIQERPEDAPTPPKSQ